MNGYHKSVLSIDNWRRRVRGGCDVEDDYDVAVYLERKDEATLTEEEYKKWLKDEGLE